MACPKTLTKMCNDLKKYHKQEYAWGRRVNRDIKALEKAVNRLEKKCCKMRPTKFGKPPRGGPPGDPAKPPPW